MIDFINNNLWIEPVLVLFYVIVSLFKIRFLEDELKYLKVEKEICQQNRDWAEYFNSNELKDILKFKYKE
jgi:hypothetical protein